MFDAFEREVIKNQWKIHGLQIARDNQVVHQMGDCKTRFPIYSATKSITSIAMGIAVDEGKISVNDSLYQYVGRLIDFEVASEKIEFLGAVTLKRLLTMTIPGLPFRPEGDNWLSYSIQCLPKNIEMQDFAYSNIPAYLAGVAVQEAVGRHMISYLKPRLFDVLEIKEPVYQDCPAGYFYGASGMMMSVKELGRIGQMCLDRGVYHGTRIVSEEWIDEATRKQVNNLEGGYGYYFWKFGDGYRISGKWGQRCIVMPKDKLVITYLSDMPDGSNMIMEAVKKYFLR